MTIMWGNGDDDGTDAAARVIAAWLQIKIKYLLLA